MEGNKTNFEEFITIYNELDSFMRRELNLRDNVPHRTLINRMSKTNRIVSRFEDELVSFSRLRNAIIHNPYKRYAEPIAEPHDYIVQTYQNIYSQIFKPEKAIDTIAVKERNIRSASLDDYAIDVMRIIYERGHSYIPIIEKGRLVGVFSEHTIFSHIVEKGEIILDEDVKIKDFANFISIHNHKNVNFIFVSKETLVIDIEEMFADQLSQDKRLAMVFITKNGKADERLLGLITVWDVAGYQGISKKGR